MFVYSELTWSVDVVFVVLVVFVVVAAVFVVVLFVAADVELELVLVTLLVVINFGQVKSTRIARIELTFPYPIVPSKPTNACVNSLLAPGGKPHVTSLRLASFTFTPAA